MEADQVDEMMQRFTTYKDWFFRKLERIVGKDREMFYETLSSTDKSFLNFE